MEIKSISDFRKVMRHGPYAWPGGYPLYLLMADGDCISFEAAKKERRSILEAIAYRDNDYSWLPIACEVNWEDTDMICAVTNKKIESAYGEDQNGESRSLYQDNPHITTWRAENVEKNSALTKLGYIINWIESREFTFSLTREKLKHLYQSSKPKERDSL